MFYELVESGNYFDIAVCTAVVVTSDMEPKYIHMPNIDLKFLLFGMKFSHVACVHSSQSMKNLGGFDEDVSIAMDTDYLLRAISSSYRFTTFDTLVFMGDDGISNKLWAKASLQYIRNLYRLNFIGPFKRILLTMAVPLRIINNHLKIISKLRDCWGQLYYLLIFIFNNAHRISPYFLRQYLYKKAGFHISDKSAVSGSVKFFTRGNLCIKKNTIINQRVYLDNRYPIHIGRNVSISHDVRIYTLGHKINDPLFSWWKTCEYRGLCRCICRGIYHAGRHPG